MKNLSLFFKIIFSTTLVTTVFMFIFSFENYDMLNKQLNLLENEKFISIAKTVEPVISINLSLGLESGYKNAIKQLFDANPEIIYVTISDHAMTPFYEQKREDGYGNIRQKEALFSLKVEMYDYLLKMPSGFITLYFTHSKYLSIIINQYNSFLIRMLFLFIGSILLLTLLVYISMKPLKNLTNMLRLYTPGDSMNIASMDGKNEVSVINNTAIEMIKKIEEELEKRLQFEKELSHKSRLESMGEMIDNIAHQWRQPLMNMNAILMTIDRAYELGTLDANCLESNIQEATNLTAHMSQTIEDFRSFFRKDKEMETVAINEVVTYSFNLLSSILKDITICFNKADEINISVYKNELIQVIISIISNAVDALQQQNIINKKIFVSIEEHQKEIDISIEDNAGGIASEHIHRIFEPYYSTKHKYGGSGLGLYICKMIVEGHMDSSLKVHNTEIGAKFTITLKKELS